MRQTGLSGQLGRWVAAAAVAAGMWVGGARDAWANWGDTCYWRNEATASDWNSESWYNATQGESWGWHDPGYVGGNKLIFDNTNHPTMQNTWGSPGSNLWQVIFNDGTPSRTITGTVVDTFYDNGGAMPKIENYTTVDQTINFPFIVGYASGMEINPVNGNLLFKKRVSANGHAINVYGSNGKTAYFETLSAGNHTTYASTMTLYVDSASKVSIGQALWGGPAANTWQDINVKDSAGYVTVTNFRYASRIKTEGAGTVEFNGQYENSGGASIWIAGGTTVLNPLSATVCFTNVAVTNGATLVLHKETRIRRVTFNSGSTVQMDVLSTNSAALLGINQLSTWTGSGYSFNGNPHTLKLVLGEGSTFNASSNASFTVYEARSDGSLADVITNRITLNTSALGGSAADTNKWTLSLTTNKLGRANGGIKLTYTAPTPQAAVGLTTTEFTYNGSTITLTPNGGSGSGAYSMAFVSGGTGTGTFNASTKVLTVTAAGTFLFDVTRAASGAYPARTDRVTVTVNKGTQANTSLTTTSFTYAGSAITLTGSGGTVGAYSYALVSGGTGTGTLSGSGATCTLTPTAAGTFFINVIRAGNNLYNAQTNQVTVTLAKGTQANTGLTTTTFTYAGSAITLTGSGGTAGAYSYALVSGGTGTGTLSGSGATCTLTPTAAGTFYVNVIRAGNNLYNAKTNQVTVTVNKGNQPTAVTLSTTTFAYSPSGLTLSGSGGTAGTYSYAYGANGTGSGSVAGSTLSVTAVGTMTVNVTRNGNNLYNSRTDTVTVTVNKASQTVGFTSSPAMVTAGKSTSVAASVTSPATGGGAVTFSGNAAGVATVTSGGSVTGVAVGQVTITATAAETDFYSEATATYVLTVRVAGPTQSGSITSVTGIGADTFTVAFTKGNGNYSVLLAKEGSAPPTPVDGTGASGQQTAASVTWTDNTSVFAFPTNSTDGTKVIRQATAGSGTVTVTAATPATHYYLALYSRNPNQNAANRMTNFSYSATAATADFWTLSTEPTGNPSLVTPTEAAGTLGSGSATINWTKGTGANNTLVVIYGPADSSEAASALAVTAPTDGQVYSGSALGGTVLHAGTGTSAPASGLTKLKWYKVVAYSYALGGDNSTANYLTPGSVITFKTLDSNGPLAWATGVDETSFLLNWTNLVAAANGFNVQMDTSSSFATVPWAVSNITFEGWSTGSLPDGTETDNTHGITRYKAYIYNYSTLSTRVVYLNINGSWFRIDGALPAKVTKVTYAVMPAANSNHEGRKVALQVQYPGEGSDTWHNLCTNAITTNGTKFVVTYQSPTPIPKGAKLRWLNVSTGSGGSVMLDDIHLEAESEPGFSEEETYLTAGTTYYVRVQNAPAASDWSDTVAVKAGVVPTGLAAGEATRDSVPFTWSGANSPSGYRWQATTNAAVAWSNQCTDGDALTGADARSLYTNAFKTGRQWMYIGTTVGNPEHAAGGSVNDTPRYIVHQGGAHYLSGKAGLGIQSTNFPIAGATNIVLSYTILNWNLGIVNATPEMGRVDAYYKLDDGPWCFLGTGLAGSAADGESLKQSFTLDKGRLEGTTIAFKVVAPNAGHGTYSGADRLVGPGVQALRVDAQVGKGDYTTLFAEGTDSGSATVEGLDANCPVYFRVQALQGSNVRSVWVETNSLTTNFGGPTPAVEATGRYEVTASWPAYDGDATGYTVSYNVQITGCSSAGADPTDVSECPESGRNWGSSTTDWTYQRAYSGSTESSYPKYADGWHKLWGQFSTTTTYPGIESPEMDLSAYVKGYVEFSHNYVNRTNCSEMTLYYKVGDGSWTSWADVPHATTWSAGSATKRTVELPPEAMGQSRVKVKLVASAAKNYLSGTNYMVQGASVFGVKVTAQGAGGGKYDCDYTSDSYRTSGTNFTFNAETLSGDSHLTHLWAGSNYYVHVQTVLTKNNVDTASDWGEDGRGTTAAPMLPPAEVWAEDIHQQHLTVAWNAAEGADEDTLYWVQVASSTCTPEAWTSVGVQPSSTNTDLTVDDDWSYIGGGTEVDSVEGVKSYETNYITGRGVYPAWAKADENSIVLAGEGAPGIESAAFSTVGATNATLGFGHGRWYARTAAAAPYTVLSLYYSTDGGASWTMWTNTPAVTNVVYAYNHPVSYELPSAALGHAQVKVRIVAENACIAKADAAAGTNGTNAQDGKNHAMGAAVTAAKVTLKGARGNYTSCLMRDVPDLTYDQLSKVFESLTNNTTYYFRVAASDGTQYGSWVDGTAKTLAPPAAPGAPWQVSAGRTSLTMTWAPVEGAEAYTLALLSASGGSVSATNWVEGTTFTWTGLTAGRTYYFKVMAHADGTSSAYGNQGSGTTAASLTAPVVTATNITLNSLRFQWPYENQTTYTVKAGPTTADGTGADEILAAPSKLLARSDAGNGWLYLGGNKDYPKWFASTSNTNDYGHVLAYTGAGMQSRWFSTWGAKAVTVEFLQGRYQNSGKNSAIEVKYSVDGGVTWVLAGTAPATNAPLPTVARSIALPAAALGKRAVAVRLMAPDTVKDNAYGAELKDVRVRVTAGDPGDWATKSPTKDTTTGLMYVDLSGNPGTRYGISVVASDDNNPGTTAGTTNSAATRTRRTGVSWSQGFEGSASGYGAFDPMGKALTLTTSFLNSDGTPATGSGWPTVTVVDGVNPLYGDKALRMSGSAAGSVFGVADFSGVEFGNSASESVTVSIPFSAQDLTGNDYLYVAWATSTDNGSTWTWHAPGATNATRLGHPVTRIGAGGGDVINRNWPYNRELNATTRPLGDAFTFRADGIAGKFKVRVAFCGQSGGAARYYWIDEVSVKRNPGMVTEQRASAQNDGTVSLSWNCPSEQYTVIIRGQDMRTPPATVDLDNLPDGYELVKVGETYAFPDGETESLNDATATSGWRYYYYFYGAIANGDGSYTLGEPVSAHTMVQGAVHAIASQGWDGWDVHPWGYTLGRVANPASYYNDSDYGYWRTVAGMYKTNVVFYTNSWETDARNVADTTGHKYTNLYARVGDADATNQLGVTGTRNYYGTNSFRLSGGGSYYWSSPSTHVWRDWEGNWQTNGAVHINTNNAAIQFDNVDLSGYKNVEFQLHYAGTNLNGGNDLHLAISTNGGLEGSWHMVKNKEGSSEWIVDENYDYGRAISDGDTSSGGNWDFYFEDAKRTPYGNPYVLKVPDTVTQFMVRVMFYDSNGGSRRNASYFIDEVRLLGEVAMETPKPIITDNGKTSLTVCWSNIPDAEGYNVKITAVPSNGVVKLAEPFAITATPVGWSNSTSGVQYQAAAKRGATGDYGLSLTGNNGMAVTPEVGAATNVTFWARAADSGSGTSTLSIQVKPSGSDSWETLKTYTTDTLGTTWTRYSVALPYRQWQQVAFKRTGTGKNIWIDDMAIYGAGDYRSVTTSVGANGARLYNGVTITNQAFTGLTAGTRYFASVQAYGSPHGVFTTSGWGETADYTTGDFNVVPDGFEMTRSTWAAPGGGILVMAVPEGEDYDSVTAPTNTTVGGINGKGVVIQNVNAEQEAPGFEHVRPYGARTEDFDAKYVVYWKRGSYWEGRLETSVTLPTYPGVAEDTFAVTNLTTGANLGTYSAAEGKGWAGGWSVWDDAASKVSVTTGTAMVSGTYTNYGLLGTNRLVGAGGNMIHFNMNSDTMTARVCRVLSSALSTEEVWVMATMRSQYGRDTSHEDKVFGVQLFSSAETLSSSIFASVGKMKFLYGDDKQPRLGIDTSLVNTMPGGSAITWSGQAGDYTYNMTDTGNQGSLGSHTLVMKYEPAKGDLYVAAFSNVATHASGGALRPDKAAKPTTWAVYKQGVADDNTPLAGVILFGYGYNGALDFDEVRVGSSWDEIVGVQTEPPQNVATAQAWTDGNELVRIAWQYAGGLTNAGVVHPLADGVRIYAKEGVGEGEWVEIYKGKGTNTAAVAKDAWSRWDHVVRTGSTHEYRVVAYASSKYADAVTAVNRDAAPSTEVSTGLYGDTEYLDTMSYTNNTGFAAGVWKGGHGFGDDPSAWTLQSDNTGTWTSVNPETADEAVHITNAVPGARLPVGNVLKATLDFGQKAGIERQLGGDPWCGGAGQAFYVAFRMAYQWGKDGEGNEWGRRAGLRITDSNLKYVEVGKARGDADGDRARFGVTATAVGSSSPSTGWTADAASMRGFGDAGATNAFLVVAKVFWTSSGRADIRAGHIVIGDAAHPGTLPGDEAEMTWTATYSNAVISNVRKLELIAQSEDSGGNLGSAYFDEIRFGTSWEDIVGATEPDDVWTAGLGVETADPNHYFKGDFASWEITSKPHGPKQSAWVVLCSNDTTFANATAASNSTTYLRKVADGTNWHSVWQGHELQFKGAGTWYGGGAVKGELVTVTSWGRPAAYGYRWNQYSVTNLPNPTKTNDVSRAPEVFTGDAKLGLAWAPAVTNLGGGNSRTFPEVMVVRFPNTAAAWTPTDGTVYLKGGKVSSGANEGTVVYRGTNETVLVDKGLNTNTTYRYQFYTVNNSHYSPGVSVSQTTSTNAPPIEINGDPNDWIGTPSEVKNSSATSPNGEWIWTDKVGDGRKDNNAAYDADITELRMKVDATNVYFMARLNCMSNAANPYIAVGITTNVDATTTALSAAGNENGENWIGDEANTFMGGNLFSPAALHYSDVQMAVHQVGGVWKIELFDKGGGSWHSPGGVEGVTWKVASSSEDACVEWMLPRASVGLAHTGVLPARFTVATFANANGWNNDVGGTVKLSDGTSYAVDTIAIAPWGQNDKDLALTAWDEGLKNANAEYWFDIWVGPGALHNKGPTVPAPAEPANNATNVPASPTMIWSQSEDQAVSESFASTGFVVGYLVEVSTNEYFNGLEGTTENGPISCRVNIPGATNTSYRYLTDSREYWWRVRARDNSGQLSDPTPWHYVVQGKTDNEGPEPRLLYVGPRVLDFINNTVDEDYPHGYRTEQELSGDATSVLDSELEDGGHTFGFVIEWYDVNGVYATNHMRDGGSGAGYTGAGKFAYNILAEHSDGVPYGRVSPNWDLVLVDRGAPVDRSTTPPGGKPADEVVGGKSYSYTNQVGGLVLPTDDGGTETVDFWYIDCGLDKVFTNNATQSRNETICDGNFGQYMTNYVVNAFSIGSYRTNLDIYLTVSAEDGCETGEYGPTQWITPPVYSTNGSAGSWAPGPQPGANGSTLSSGWCADFPNPARNVTTNRLLHIHVRDNDTIPPTASTAKWRAAATNESGEGLFPSVAVATGERTGSGVWDATWANLDANGLKRLPTYDGQGKTLQWQLTDGDVAVDGVFRGSTNKLNFFFNVYDEYLHSGMQTNTVASNLFVKAITESLNRTNWLENTGMILKNASGTVWTNWAGYSVGLSQNLRQDGESEHGLGTDPNTVLAWTYDATQTNVEALLGASELLMNSTIGTNPAGEQLVVTNALKLFAWDSDNNAPGDQEGAELEFGQLIFTDDDATAPEAVGFTSFGTGTNFTHFGDVAKWTFSTNASGSIVTTTNPLMRAIAMSPVVTGRVSSASSSPDSDGPETVKWNSNKNAIYLQGNMNADTYRAANSRYFLFKVGGNGTTVWRSDMLAFYNRVSPTGPTKFALTMQGAAGISKPAAADNSNFSGDWGRTTDENSALSIGTVGGYNRTVKFESIDTSHHNGEATLTSPPFSCKDIGSLTLEYKVGRLEQSNSNSRATYLYVDYGVSATENGTPAWIATPLKKFCHAQPASLPADTEPGWTTTLSTDDAGHTDVTFELFTDGDPSLKGTDNWVTFRFRAVNLGGTGGAKKIGFGVVDPKVTAGDTAGSAERLLGTVEVEKTIAAADKNASGGDSEEKVGSYANTETDVILSFDGHVVGTGTNLVTFRLYGYGATRLDANTGEVKTDNTQFGTWAIKNLYLHGTATEPKHSEVTDYDIAKGAWTNRLEVMDGAMGGYDTVRSGLWVKDDGASANEEVPSFRILYPTYYNGTTHSYPNGTSEVVTESNLIMRAAASAMFDTIPNPEFDSTNHWDLGGGAGIAGGRLTLPGPDPETGASAVSSAANTNLTLRAMSDVTGVTIAGTVRARGTLTVTNGGVNTLTVTAQAYDSEGVTVGDLFATNITANASWKNYAVGPWTLTASTVAKVRFTVKQTDTDSTEMLVDELRMHVAQWGEDISAEDPEQAAAFAAAVTNGMEAAKLLVRTPDLDLRTVSVPLSTNHSGGATQPTAEWYRLEATVHDYDHDRTGDALSASATTNFWLYDDDTMVPQYGSKYGGPLGVFMNGTIIPQAWRTGISSNSEISKLSQKWPITDAELTSMESNAPVTFALSFYDYSGWYTKKLLVGNSTNGFSTIQENGAVTSGAGTIGWSAPEKNDGEEEDPGATSTWSIGAKAMYTAYSNYFIGDYSESGSVMEVKAEVWDKDNDRKDDDLAFSDDGGDPRRVGYVWFADQDVWAPTWGSQTRPYSKVMLSTNVPNTAAGYAAMVNTNEGSLNPYAVGGIANNQIEDFAGRSYTIYDGELNDLNAPENDKLFAVTVNINDPLPTGEGARARKNSGLQVGSQLTDWRSMWGSPTNDTSSSDVFAVTNSYVVLAPAGGANALTNAAVNGDFSEPVSKTRVAMQAGHMSWTWASFPTNDIGKLLPGGEEASVQLTIHAYDADMNRHNDQMHAELAGPTITLRDDDTQGPTAPSDVTLTGLTLPEAGVELTRLNAPWTNNLGGVKLGFTAATDPAYTAKPGDIKTAGIARYQLAAPDVTPGVEIGSVVKEVTDQSITSYSDLSLAGIGSIDQGFGAYQLFAVDADADRPGDAMAGDAAPVPLAYDITPPTKIGVDYTKRLIADPESADDPTTQFQLSWPIAGVGPDDPEDENYIDTTYKVSRVETLSPWYSYKIYYTNYEESAIAADDDPNDDSKSWVYQTFISDPTATNYYKNWAFVMTNSPVQDPTAPKSGGRSTAYDSLGSVTANVGATNQSVRLYDLDFDQHYIVVIVGVDKAGNEGPAGMWSWATNNTIKFAVTQGVVRATAQINAMLPSDATALGNIGMKRIPLSLTPQYTPPKQGATLYWMAAGQKEEGGVRTGPVSKEYDLIYRDAPSFTEDPGKPWFMASSGRGTNVNSGTSKTNWNYHADDFSGIGRGNLRFYRASYKGRWNPSGDALPLASEEVYAMNRVPLVEGRNLVALHGVPYTNTFAGVFGTDASIFPGGSSLADATRVEFFDGQKGATLNARQSFYFVDNGGVGQWWQVNVSYPPVANPRAAANPSKEKWCERSGSEGNYFYTPSTDTSVAGNKTYYKLSEYIKLIYLDGNPSEWGLFERSGNAYVASEDTEPVEGKTYYEKGAYRYVPVDPERDVSPRMEGWFVDAGGGVYARSNDEWVQAGTTYLTRTDSPTDYSPPSGVVPMENVTDFCWDDPNFFSRGFEIVIPDLSSRPDFQTRQTTNGIADPATERNWQWGFDWYPILKVPTTNGTETATNGTFSVEVQGGGTGTDAARYTLVSLNMPVAAHPGEMNLWQSGFHSGDGMMTGDAIYIWDNEAGDIRSGNVVYYNGTDWKMWQGDNPNADVPLGFFKPGDVIVIKSMSSGNWTWTYSPTNFYTLPTRHMGR